MQQEIKVGSVTNAQRGVKILRSNGISTSVSRLEHPGAADGCGFALRVDASDLNAPLNFCVDTKSE